MKKIFFLLAVSAIGFTQSGFAQDSANAKSSQLLVNYYLVKNALVGTNSTKAATAAGELVKSITISQLPIKDDAKKALLKDAEAISKSTDIKIQREKFATLSNTMFELAKSIKLSTDPIYQEYCPMKKASWLSADKAIKNPYYGNMMLSCGSVVTTL